MMDLVTLDITRTGPCAVEDGAASPDAVGVVEDLEPLGGPPVARVEDEAMGVDDRRRADVLFAVQNGGQAVVQAAQRMHLVVSSYRARSSGDWSRSVGGGGSSLTR